MENNPKNQKEANEEFASQELKALDLPTSEITEEILEKCGGFGLFQKGLTVFISIFAILYAQTILSMVFIREKIPFDCYPSNFNESMIPPNVTLDELLNRVNIEKEECSVYNLDTKEGFYTLPTSNSSKEPCNNGRKFYTEDLSTIVSEFDLTCDRDWMRNIAFSIMFAGFMLGNLLFGVLSDKFGRFKTFCVADSLLICCALAKIYAPNYIVFIIFYFAEGIGLSGTYIVLYTILIECVSQKYRSHLNFIMHTFFAVGEIILAGVAYVLRKWHHLLYATTIPHILFVIIALKYLPESPRWLLNEGRFERAEESFNRIARTNKKDNEDMIKLIRKLQRDAESKSEFNGKIIETVNHGNNRKTKDKTYYTAIDLLKKPRRAMISINLWFNWFVNAMIYYGVTLNSIDMSGSRYLNFLLMSAVEIPATILGYFMFKWFGHRKPLCLFLVFGGINCIVANFVAKVSFWFPLILTVLGKLGTTAAFDGVFLTSAELFPTVVRNNGLSTSVSFSRIGALLSPVILGLSVYGFWIPLTTYGLLGIAAGLLILLLPEMKDACLLQTLEDMDNL
ncbi:organic cation transporter protein-like isoform X2 [Octopus sinensis]|uniref:Organic cation transporter protein-like isoform X2 n=1 Tax=Octopus sinensis TaxID=2607531 RepID=A0A7E6F9C9_9MOLL|nr:organic cation transporter protein-like isoform X2 [Octopus sinensis]